MRFLIDPDLTSRGTAMIDEYGVTAYPGAEERTTAYRMGWPLGDYTTLSGGAAPRGFYGELIYTGVGLAEGSDE